MDGIEALDGAFELTPLVADPKLRELYEVIVARLRQEASSVPMNTVQQLLIERIAANYIMLKAREAVPIGDDQGFAHTTAVKDFNTFWLGMTREFNAQLHRFGPNDHEATLRRVRDVIVSELSNVEDGALRNELTDRFVRRFDAESL